MIKIYGPYKRTDGRKHVILYDTETKTRKTKSYPKYLLEKKLGRNLTLDETTDHVDNNFRNNKDENLQILSLIANIKKSKSYIAKIYSCGNINCNNAVSRTPSQLGKLNVVFCSVKCRSKIVKGNQYTGRRV